MLDARCMMHEQIIFHVLEMGKLHRLQELFIQLMSKKKDSWRNSVDSVPR